MTTQPNIILCTCDQLRAHAVGCYGDPVARTPHIDRLAAGGLRFEHAVTPNPVYLSPILTGDRDALAEPYAFIEASDDGPIGIRTPRYLFGLRTDKETRAILDEGRVFWDLEQDPCETNNLADPARANEPAAELDRLLRAWDARTPWMARASATCE